MIVALFLIYCISPTNATKLFLKWSSQLGEKIVDGGFMWLAEGEAESHNVTSWVFTEQNQHKQFKVLLKWTQMKIILQKIFFLFPSQYIKAFRVFKTEVMNDGCWCR